MTRYLACDFLAGNVIIISYFMQDALTLNNLLWKCYIMDTTDSQKL